MKQAPYSLEEAEILCQEFQSLIGSPFESGDKAIIKNVVVSPYSNNSRKRFLMCYLLFDDARKALEYEFDGIRYDVLILAGTPGEEDLRHEALDIWINKNMYALCGPMIFSAGAAQNLFCSFHDINDDNKI
jgi:hypothetical protein